MNTRKVLSTVFLVVMTVSALFPLSFDGVTVEKITDTVAVVFSQND